MNEPTHIKHLGVADCEFESGIVAFDKRAKLPNEVVNLRCRLCRALDDDVGRVCGWVAEVSAEVWVVHALEVILKFAFEEFLRGNGAIKMANDHDNEVD